MHILPLLFGILLLSALGQAVQIDMFLNRVKRFQHPDDHRRIRWVIKFFYTMYFFMFSGFVPDSPFEAICREGLTYPFSFLFIMYLHVIMFIYSFTLYASGYCMRKKLIEKYEKNLGRSAFKDLMLNHKESGADKLLDKKVRPSKCCGCLRKKIKDVEPEVVAQSEHVLIKVSPSENTVNQSLRIESIGNADEEE